MTEPTPNDDNSRQLEEIVAYLDGELSPQESAQVERRLASDAAYRRQLQGIERAWAALDDLPAASVDDAFSKTTMEMVVNAARNDVQQRTQALPIERRNRWLSTTLLATVAALLGALVFRVAWKDPDRALLADLPVIQYIDVYSQFQDINFLRQLHRGLRDDSWQSAGDPAEAVEQFNLVSSSDSREKWLTSLQSQEDERVALRAKFNRFRALSPEEQERLRSLHESVKSAPDSAELEGTMLEYQQWLNGLPPSEQYELRAMGTDQRVHRVVEMVERQREREFLELTPEELRAVTQAVKPKLEEMRKQAFVSMSPEDQKDLQSSFGRGRFWKVINQIPDSQRGELMRTVQNALPPEKAEQFARLSPPERVQRLLGWLRQAMRPDSPDRRDGDRRRRDEVSQQDLEAFFVEELDAADKERLLAMPRERMQQELERRYNGEYFPRNWNEPGGNDRDRRRGDGPPMRFDEWREGPRRDGPREGPPRDGRRPDRGPPEGPPRFGPDGPPGPPPPPQN